LIGLITQASFSVQSGLNRNGCDIGEAKPYSGHILLLVLLIQSDVTHYRCRPYLGSCYRDSYGYKTICPEYGKSICTVHVVLRCTAYDSRHEHVRKLLLGLSLCVILARKLKN
jgi:hypothetical protein